MAALERPRRAQAGRNISKLLDQEEVADDFYKTAYGGFGEEEEDNEYETEESEDDAVDSDFDASEEDEVMYTEKELASEEQEEQRRRKKKQWIKPAKQHQPSDASDGMPKPKRSKHTLLSSLPPEDIGEQRILRRSTQETSAEHRQRQKEAKRWGRHAHHARRRAAAQQRKLTQQEMLEEARWTELENKASLEMFTRLEEEKKQVKEKKRVIKGPYIRFHSVTMPVISDLEPSVDQEEREKPTSDDPTPSQQEDATPSQQQQQDCQQKQQQKEEQPQKYARNFVVFTDTAAYNSTFFPAIERPQKPKRLMCHITGLPAKYIDPITSTPYATPQAFKIIRSRYVRSAEEKCEKRLLQLSSWLEEKKRKKQESNN